MWGEIQEAAYSAHPAALETVGSQTKGLGGFFLRIAPPSQEKDPSLSRQDDSATCWRGRYDFGGAVV